MIQIIPDRNGKLTQWDIDRYVLITGLINTENTEAHIASDSDKYGAYVVLPENSDDSIKAVIPNILLTYAGMIHIYIYQNGATIYHQYFSVPSREKPDDYIYTPSEVDGYIRIKEEEAKRQAAEDERVSAEAIRQANETERNSAEAERIKAEDERVAAENVRQSNEMSRANSEYDRAASEASRISAEQTREKNEITRSSNEINRQSNENERQNSEEDRIEFETARAAAESLRLQNETARTASENERISAETQRTANEAGRVSAEAARVEAEANRQGTYQQYGNQIGDLDLLTTNAKSSLVAAINENRRDIEDIFTSIDEIQNIDSQQSDKIAALVNADAAMLKQIAANTQSISSNAKVIAANTAAITDNVNSITAINKKFGNYYTQSETYSRTEVDKALDKKQPIGNYVTSVNGTTPDKNGNVSINVQTYTAGDGISIDEGAISVTNPMDDEQVSETTTWSSAKIISSVSQPFSQSGSIITCQPVEGSPLHVVSEITAVQEGEGDPSPENIRPIVGWDGANLVRCGTNLWPDYIVSTITPSGNTVTVNDDDGWIDVHKVAGASINQRQTGIFLPLSTYTLSNGIDTGSSVYFQVDNDNGNNLYTLSYPTLTSEILLRDGNIYLYSDRLIIADVSLRPSLNVGSSVLPYEPYRGQTYTADFGEIVYGGTLDWATGVLTVTWQQFQITDSTRLSEVTSWSRPEENTIAVAIMDTGHKAGRNNIAFNKLKYGSISSDFAPWIYMGNTSGSEVYVRVPGTTLEEARQNMVSQSIVGITEIATPYTIQLTPAQVLAISGTNTVYCDTGDVTVSGYEDPRTTIANLSARIAALESAASGV